jgi:hypothetical protein
LIESLLSFGDERLCQRKSIKHIQHLWFHTIEQREKTSRELLFIELSQLDESIWLCPDILKGLIIMAK